MDSLTQFTLGAAVGAAVLGPRIGARRAALLGGLYGTVPDLDTFLPSDDPVQSFTTHRGATHSLIMQAVVTPLFAEPLVRLFRDLRDKRVLAYAAVYLIFATHALIDAITVYGTQLLWPLSKEPFGVGSVFIIDPLYTLPLFIVVVWALFVRTWSPLYQRWVRGALAVSTVYMLLTLPAQAWVKDRATTLLAANGVTPERLLALPAPLNTLFWRVIAIDGDRYLNLYVPLLGGEESVSVYAHPRHLDLGACLAEAPQFARLQAFTDGYYRFEEEDGKILMVDLRMGTTPSYVFRFALAEQTSDGPRLLETPLRIRTPRSNEGDGPWLWAGINGKKTTRPVEASAQLDLADLEPGGDQLASAGCRSGSAPS